jgi:hypothetical protein
MWHSEGIHVAKRDTVFPRVYRDSPQNDHAAKKIQPSDVVVNGSLTRDEQDELGAVLPLKSALDQK